MSTSVLKIPVLVWVRMIWDLRRRGGGRRESGAFLLGTRGEKRERVKGYVCYDDLDPAALESGIVVLRSQGFSKLWALCKQQRLQVLADVHTHGDDHPRQSRSDRTNPMINQAGHIAFILPRFAGTWGWRFRNVAVYEYQGELRWRDLQTDGRRERVRFALW
ncbi:MAG: Mov34/MPN/PAD-1 family protein [Pirellulales bacterium]